MTTKPALLRSLAVVLQCEDDKHTQEFTQIISLQYQGNQQNDRINTCMPVISLNVNYLQFSNKKTQTSRQDLKTESFCCLQEMHLNLNDSLRVRVGNGIPHGTRKQTLFRYLTKQSSNQNQSGKISHCIFMTGTKIISQF